MRDLAEDLKVCEAATRGPWRIVGKDDWGLRGFPQVEMNTHDGKYFPVHCDADARFIVAAREGWPEAIKRAMAAENEVERLRGELEQERCKAESFLGGLKDARECEQAMFVLADKWHSEAEQLRQQLADAKKLRCWACGELKDAAQSLLDTEDIYIDIDHDGDTKTFYCLECYKKIKPTIKQKEKLCGLN